MTKPTWIKHCNDWAKDTRRCCPQACWNTEPFTKAVCEASGGKGTCIYPNDAQCSEKQETPRVNSVHVNIGRYYPKSLNIPFASYYYNCMNHLSRTIYFVSIHIVPVSTSVSSVTTTSSPTSQSRSTITTAKSPLQDWSEEDEALGRIKILISF